MTRSALLSALSSVALAACGGVSITTVPSTATPSDGGTPEADARPPEPTFVARIIGGQCLPQKLPTDANGLATCVVVEALAGSGGESACGATPGLSEPDADTLALVRKDTSVASTTPLCAVAQLPASSQAGATCTASSAPGWCYRTGPASGLECPQSIAFSPSGTPAAGAQVWLACP